MSLKKLHGGEGLLTNCATMIVGLHVPLHVPFPFCFIVTFVTRQWWVSFGGTFFLMGVVPINLLEFRAVVTPPDPVAL